MLVVDLPRWATGTGRSVRVGILSSCRLRNPFLKMQARGLATVVLAMPGFTHTVDEAIQMARFVRGSLDISPELSPFVFGGADVPPRPEFLTAILDSIDIGIVEVCDRNQARFDQYLLQQNYLAQNLARAHPAAMLAWYRNFGHGRPTSEQLAEETLGRLRDAGVEPSETTAGIIRRGQRVSRTDEELQDSLATLRREFGQRWIAVSHFAIPGDEGRVMQDRRSLATGLARAAAALGMEFFDPSIFIERYGRATVLDADGADIYEYAVPFQDVLVDRMYEMMFGRMPLESDQPNADDVVTDLNHRLIALHAERVARLGVDDSGLYDHFKTRLDAGSLIGDVDVRALHLVADHLPAFRHCVVFRAGIGELALPLAASGLDVIACEENANRLQAIRDAASALAPAIRRLAGLRCVAGREPPLDSTDRAHSLAIALNQSHLLTEDAQNQALRMFAGYGGLLIEPRLFLGRHDQAGQTAVLERLRAAGFDRIREFPHTRLVFAERSM